MGSVTHQDSELGSSNSSVYANSFGPSGRDARNDMNNFAGLEWDSCPIGKSGPGLQGGHPDQYRSMSHLAEQAAALPSQYLDPELFQEQEAGMGLYSLQVTFHARNIIKLTANHYL